MSYSYIQWQRKSVGGEINNSNIFLLHLSPSRRRVCCDYSTLYSTHSRSCTQCCFFFCKEFHFISFIKRELSRLLQFFIHIFFSPPLILIYRMYATRRARAAPLILHIIVMLRRPEEEEKSTFFLFFCCVSCWVCWWFWLSILASTWQIVVHCTYSYSIASFGIIITFTSDIVARNEVRLAGSNANNAKRLRRGESWARQIESRCKIAVKITDRPRANHENNLSLYFSSVTLQFRTSSR